MPFVQPLRTLWLAVKVNLKETTENYFVPFVQPLRTLWLAVEINLKENTKNTKQSQRTRSLILCPLCNLGKLCGLELVWLEI